MTPQETPIEIIQELIQLHQDRVALYHQALGSTRHPDRLDLKMILGEIIHETIEYKQELKDSLVWLDGRSNGQEEEHKGPVYRVWEAEKVPIRGDSSKSILETCEQESEAVQKAYQTALSLTDSMDDILRLRLKMQMADVRNIENKIRTYHNAL